MASIYQRGKIWWIHYSVGGKSVSKSLKTSNDRVAMDRKKKIEALEITHQLLEPSSTPITAFLQSFCEYLFKTRTRKSAKNDISYLRGFFGPCCPALQLGSNVPKKYRQDNVELPVIRDKLHKRHVPVRKLEDISSEMISNYIQDRLVQDNIKTKTANRTREVLHRMFAYAAEHYGYICPDRRYKNPAEGVKRLQTDANPIRWLEGSDIILQLNALKTNPLIYTMVAVYIYAGLRREEVLWLTKNDMDYKNRLIRIRSKTIEGEYWQPKTKKDRVVPISTALWEVLQGYRSPVDSIWFFPSPKGQRWDPDNFSQELRELNKKGALSWSCLDFRHTFGSQLAQKGESLYKISELMGNSPDICRQHYAALVPERMKDTVEFTVSAGMSEGIDQKDIQRLLKQILKKLDDKNTHRPRIRLVR